MQRIRNEELFFRFWHTRTDDERPTRDSCLVLDSEYYYQWRPSKCGDSGEERETARPQSHHFICQMPALQDSSIEMGGDSQEVIERIILPDIRPVTNTEVESL